MITNRHHYDYERKPRIIPQLIQLCEKCGENFFRHPDGVEKCVSCKSTLSVTLFENQAPTFRAGLWEKQKELARQIVADQRPTFRHDMTDEPPMSEVEADLEWLGIEPPTASTAADVAYGQAGEPHGDGHQFGSAAWFAGVEPLDPDSI